mgnify:CR=1 FL=1
MKPVKNEAIPSFSDTDLELYFFTEVLKLGSLHYGCWSDGDDLTLDKLRKAQARYTDTLLALIPAERMSILDVGAGVGDVAEAMFARGHSVTALSPDKNHAKYYQNSQVIFCNVAFEAFESTEMFDLILMSESHNYFDTEIGFQQCRRLLKPGGYLLISGKFKKQPTRLYHRVVTIEADYIRRAREHGFELLQQIDITQDVLPTLQLARQFVDDYLVPTMGLVDVYLRSAAPWKARLMKAVGKLLLAKQVRQLNPMLGSLQEHVDVDRFQEHLTYQRLLFVYAPYSLSRSMQVRP